MLAALGGAAAAWPLAARAQQQPKLPTIGVLSGSTPDRLEGLDHRLRSAIARGGRFEGRTVAIEYRWAEGRSERAPELAADLVRRKVDVIVTTGGVLLTTKQATSAIPIVFATANDPVGSGFVASLPRPGGNVTGFTNINTESSIHGKYLELAASACLRGSGTL